ncbi:MAG: DUF3108 domain-containing protein [bacterium]
MNRILLPVLLVQLVLISLVLSISYPAENDNPFSTGEVLTFELKWGFISAGKTTLEIHPMEIINGVTSYHFVMKTRTNKFIDKIYKVRDQIDAYAAVDMNHSLLFKKKQREGRYKRDVVVTFDWDKNEAQYLNRGKPKEPITIFPETLDPLSAFYALRFKELKEGLDIEIPITDGKKCVKSIVKIVQREKIKVSGVEYDTYLVQPDTKDVGGVFKESKDAKIKIWITADKRHIPVRLKSKVLIGSFTGDLISIEE